MLIPQTPPPFILRNFIGAECVPVWCWQMFCQGLLVCTCLTWPFSERSSEVMTFAWSKVTQAEYYMVHCGGGNRPTPHARICCACITGTITCTNCQASQVVR